MKWNPLYNAFGAAGYIWIVGILMHYVTAVNHNTPDTFLDPIIVLSLLVFSAAAMAFLFFYRPVVLLLENKRKEAVTYFLQTLGIFGVLTLLVALTLLKS
jgi:hypothetical protein